VSCPGRESLDACAAGETAPERAAAIEAHARSCGLCGQRLEWLRRENEAIRAWAAPGDTDVERLWAGIRSGIARKPARRWIPAAALAAAAAAAMAVLVLHGNRDAGEEETPSAARALARAEVDYAHAVAALEAKVEARHPAGRQANALGRARTGLQRARDSAGRDASARARVLEGYAAYLKSLRRALQDDEP
jgi:hypothetical protein